MDVSDTCPGVGGWLGGENQDKDKISPSEAGAELGKNELLSQPYLYSFLRMNCLSVKRLCSILLCILLCLIDSATILSTDGEIKEKR